MAILSIENLEKHEKDTVLFPSFNLTINKSEIIAIYSSLNVRKVLLDIFIGKLLAPGGEILVNGQNLIAKKAAYFNEVGVLFFEDGLYDRLTIMDHFKFYQGIHDSNQTIDQILQLTQLETKKHVKIKKLIAFRENTGVIWKVIISTSISLYI